MRPVGTIDNEQEARQFGDYLLTLGVTNQVDPGKQGWIVWVRDEEDVPRAKAEFREFLADPENERFHRARATEKIRRAAAREDAERVRRIESPRREWFARTRSSAWGVSRMSLRASPVTLALIAASVGVAVATRLGRDPGDVMNMLLIAPLPLQPGHPLRVGLDAVRHGEVWRLVTPIFLHFGFLHILFNLWWLRDFGMMIEPTKGSLKLAGIVLVTAVVSNLAQYAWSGPLMGGMSGVLYGLFGYVWMKHRFAPWEGLAVSQGTVVVLLLWLFLCMTGWMGPVGDAAHVSGLATGSALGYAPVLRLRLRQGRRIGP